MSAYRLAVARALRVRAAALRVKAAKEIARGDLPAARGLRAAAAHADWYAGRIEMRHESAEVA